MVEHYKALHNQNNKLISHNSEEAAKHQVTLTKLYAQLNHPSLEEEDESVQEENSGDYDQLYQQILEDNNENQDSFAQGDNNVSPSPKKSTKRIPAPQTKVELGTVIEESLLPSEHPNHDQSAQKAGNQTFKTMMTVNQRN